MRIGNVFIQAAALIASAVSIALCLGLYWFLRSTELGRLIRASAQDRDAALMSGVNVDRMYLIAFCIGVGSLGLVAPLIAPFNYVSPSVGSNFTLTAFIVVVLGSMGNFAGALIGGFIIGLVEAVGGLVTGGSINFIITYAIFILFLLFKPEGLLGRAPAMRPMLLLGLAVALLAGAAPLLSDLWAAHLRAGGALRLGGAGLEYPGRHGRPDVAWPCAVRRRRRLRLDRALSQSRRQSLDRPCRGGGHRWRAGCADGLHGVPPQTVRRLFRAGHARGGRDGAAHRQQRRPRSAAPTDWPFPPGRISPISSSAPSSDFATRRSAVLAVVSAVILAIHRSRLGYVFLAIRENERSAAALGIDVVQGKVIAAAISGALAALVGPVYANYVLFIDPESVLGVPLSIDALVFSFVGGLGSLFGPLLGAVVLVPLTELLRGMLAGRLAGIHLIIYGIILILVMRLAPRGLWGLLTDSIARRAK